MRVKSPRKTECLGTYWRSEARRNWRNIWRVPKPVERASAINPDEQLVPKPQRKDPNLGELPGFIKKVIGS